MVSTLQKKVLVVDDDPIIGRSFSGVLSGKGYAVITAHDGEEALKKINSEKYDIVFTDIKMPGMSGIEVAQRIRASQPWLPVVIITGYGSDDNRKQAEAAGVSDFLNKPLSPDVIERSTKDAIEKSEASAAPIAGEKAEEVPAPETKGMPESIIVFPRNVKLYFAAPFVGLAHTITLPLEGLDMLGAMGEEGMVKRGMPAGLAWFLRNVAFLSLAPLLELAYLIALPVVGLGILAWMGWREMKKAFGLGVEEAAAREPEGEEFSLGTIKAGAHKAALQLEAAAEAKVAEAAVESKPATIGAYLKNILMFFTAPFIGLVYVITFPFVGLGALSYMGVKELVRCGMSERVAKRIKDIALFFIAPFIGLAYILALPFVGLGLLLWMAIKRFMK